MLVSLQVYEPDATVSFTTDYRASQVLWPHENQEELKRQVGNHAWFRIVSPCESFLKGRNIYIFIIVAEKVYI